MSGAFPSCGGEAQALLLVATAIAAAIAESHSIEDSLVISALLEAIGDQLALYTAVAARCEAHTADDAGPNIN